MSANDISPGKIIQAADVHDKVMETVNNLLSYARIIQQDLTNFPLNSTDSVPGGSGTWRDSFYVSSDLQKSKEYLSNLIDGLSSTYLISSQIKVDDYDGGIDQEIRDKNAIDDLRTAKYLIRSFADVTNLRYTKMRSITVSYDDFWELTDSGKIDCISNVYEWMFPKDETIWGVTTNCNAFNYNWYGHFPDGTRMYDNRSDAHIESGIEISGGRYLNSMTGDQDFPDDGKFGPYLTAYRYTSEIDYIESESITPINTFFDYPGNNAQHIYEKWYDADCLPDTATADQIHGHVITAKDVKDLISTLNAINGYIIHNLECHYGFIPWNPASPPDPPTPTPPSWPPPPWPWRPVNIIYDPQKPGRWKNCYSTPDPLEQTYETICYSRHKIKTPAGVGWNVSNAYMFLGWTNNSTGTVPIYQPNQNLNVLDKPITLYPIYRLKEITLNLLSSCYEKFKDSKMYFITDDTLKKFPITMLSTDMESHSQQSNQMVINLDGFANDSHVILDVEFALNIANRTQNLTGKIRVTGDDTWHTVIKYLNTESDPLWGGYNNTGIRFVSETNKGSRTTPWDNTKVYDLLCDPYEKGHTSDARMWYVPGWSGQIEAVVQDGKVIIEYQVNFTTSTAWDPPHEPVACEWMTYVYKVRPKDI